MLWTLIGSVLLLTVSTCRGLYTDCSTENVNTCKKLMYGYEGELASAVVPTLAPADIKIHCNMYYDFAKCIEPFKSNCRITEQRTFEGSASAYDWLCKEAFDDYIAHYKCLQNPLLHTEGEFCNNTLRTKMDIHLDTYNSTLQKRDRLCLYIEDYLDCVENTVTSFCDGDAAAWQRELDTRSMKPLLQQINCPGWRDSDGRQDVHLVILSVLIAASILIFIFVVLIILYIRRRRKSPRPRVLTPPEAELPLPPPYTASPSMVLYQPGAEGVAFPNSPGTNEKMTPPPYSPPSADLTDMAAAGGSDNPGYTPYQELKIDLTNQPDESDKTNRQ